MILVGFFAVFHGHAHGTEMSSDIGAVSYAIGFIISTALLHTCGIVIALLTQKFTATNIIRYVGAAIVMGGFFLWFN